MTQPHWNTLAFRAYVHNVFICMLINSLEMFVWVCKRTARCSCSSAVSKFRGLYFGANSKLHFPLGWQFVTLKSFDLSQICLNPVRHPINANLSIIQSLSVSIRLGKWDNVIKAQSKFGAEYVSNSFTSHIIDRCRSVHVCVSVCVCVYVCVNVRVGACRLQSESK